MEIGRRQIGLVGNHNNEEESYRGPYRVVLGPSMSIFGDILKRDSQIISMLPCLVYEPFYDEKGNEIGHFRLEEVHPTEVSLDHNVCIQPISREYFKRVMERYKSQSVNVANEEAPSTGKIIKSRGHKIVEWYAPELK